MRKLSVYLVVVVGSLLGYFASLSVEKTIMENVGVKVSESSEGNSAFKRLGFQHSHFKCNHNHGNIISQEDRDKYNSLLRKALAEKDSLELKLEDLPDCPLKDELAHFNDEEMIKNTLHRLIDLNPPVEDLEEIHVDKNGGIFYACKGLALEGGADLHEERLDNLDSSDVNGSVPISSPPVRHSKPDSVNTIYLDFNGENISGTGWNSGSEEWVCQPYNRDSDPTTFNEDEQLNILTAWAKVAEDYAPFDVNVTTERPAVMNSRVAHVMITPGKDANGVYGISLKLALLF